MASPEAPAPGGDPERGSGPSLDELASGSSRSLGDWRWLWEGDRPFPIRSHRGPAGRLIVLVKRWLRPLLRAPLADLWDRQRTFNLVVLGHLEDLRSDLTAASESVTQLQRDLGRLHEELLRDLREVRDDLHRDVQNNHRRLTHLEGFKRDGFEDVMRHSDALYALVDQKLDRYRRQSHELMHRLGALLARVDAGAEGMGAGTPVDGENAELGKGVSGGSAAAAEVRAATAKGDRPGAGEIGMPDQGSEGAAGRVRALARAWDEQAYQGLEDRFRGTREEIAQRAVTYLPYLEKRGPVLDLGCGRGETLAVLKEQGVSARGVDTNAEMIRACREQGLEVEEQDLLAALEAAPEGGLGGVLCLHVVEHLPPAAVDRLARLAWRALEPGGVLALETPNPLSLVVAARNFWLDPTHQRPVHPATLQLLLEQAGFDPIERLELRPFGPDDLLPEVATGNLEGPDLALAHQLNELRDRLNALLFGHQDYALIATRPA